MGSVLSYPSFDNYDFRHGGAEDTYSIAIDSERISGLAILALQVPKLRCRSESTPDPRVVNQHHWLIGPYRNAETYGGGLARTCDATWRMNMENQPIQPMNALNVHEFDVRIFDARDLVVSVVPLHAPATATTESWIFEMDPRGSSIPE